jgi:hypothetical protein
MSNVESKKRKASGDPSVSDGKRKKATNSKPSEPRRSARIQAIHDKAALKKEEVPIPDLKPSKTKAVSKLKTKKTSTEPSKPKGSKKSKVTKKSIVQTASSKLKAPEKRGHEIAKNTKDSQPNQKNDEVKAIADDQKNKQKSDVSVPGVVKAVSHSIQHVVPGALSGSVPMRHENVPNSSAKVRSDHITEPKAPQRTQRPILSLDTAVMSTASSRSLIKKLHSPIRQPETLTNQDQTRLQQHLPTIHTESSSKQVLSSIRRPTSPLKVPPSEMRQSVSPGRRCDNQIKTTHSLVQQPTSSGKSFSSLVKGLRNPIEAAERPPKRSRSPISRPESPLKRAGSPLKQLGGPPKRLGSPMKPNNPSTSYYGQQSLSGSGNDTASTHNPSQSSSCPTAGYEGSYAKSTTSIQNIVHAGSGYTVSEELPTNFSAWAMPRPDAQPTKTKSPDSPILPFSKDKLTKYNYQLTDKPTLPPLNLPNPNISTNISAITANPPSTFLSTTNTRPSVGQPPTPIFPAPYTNRTGTGPRSPRPVSKASSTSQPDRPPTPRPPETTAIGTTGTEEQRALQNVYYLEMLEKVTRKHVATKSAVDAQNTGGSTATDSVKSENLVPGGGYVGVDNRGADQRRDHGENDDNLYYEDDDESGEGDYGQQSESYHDDGSEIDATQFPGVPEDDLDLQYVKDASLRSRSLFGDSGSDGEGSKATSKA